MYCDIIVCHNCRKAVWILASTPTSKKWPCYHISFLWQLTLGKDRWTLYKGSWMFFLPSRILGKGIFVLLASRNPYSYLAGLHRQPLRERPWRSLSILQFEYGLPCIKLSFKTRVDIPLSMLPSIGQWVCTLRYYISRLKVDMSRFRLNHRNVRNSEFQLPGQHTSYQVSKTSPSQGYSVALVLMGHQPPPCRLGAHSHADHLDQM